MTQAKKIVTPQVPAIAGMTPLGIRPSGWQLIGLMPPLKDRQMWAMWRDFFISSKTWRMKTPIGVLSFKTKKSALMAKRMYEVSVAAQEAK
jgi:hypothetical protein